MTDPNLPFLEEFFQTAGWCKDLTYMNDYLYVSTNCSFQILNNKLVGIDDDFNPTYNETECELSNYPNPFSHTTTISFSITGITKNTELSIYNLKGQKVKSLIDQNMEEGKHSVIWDGKNNSGNNVSPGVYIYQLKTGNDFSGTKKILLL